MNVREWCRANGIEIADKGRIQQAILSAFAAGDVEAAKRVTSNRRDPNRPKRKYTKRTPEERELARRTSTAAVRAWAIENGWKKVAVRGRLSHEILVAYRRAMESEAEIAGVEPVMNERAARALTAEERIDRLEMMLRSAGEHLSQQPER